MHNMVYLIGRIAKELEIEKIDDRNKATITIAVQRNFKNEFGIYECDFVPCILWNGIAVHTSEYCQKGDLVGIKGRIQMIDEKLMVVADKISFLSSRTPETLEKGENDE